MVAKRSKWWKMVKIGFWEAPRSEFGYRVTGSTEMFYQLRTENGPKMVEKRCFWGCFEQMGRETWHTRPNQTSKTRKIAKIAKMMKKWVFDKICKNENRKIVKMYKSVQSVYINAHMSLSQGFLMCTLVSFESISDRFWQKWKSGVKILCKKWKMMKNRQKSTLFDPKTGPKYVKFHQSQLKNHCFYSFSLKLTFWDKQEKTIKYQIQISERAQKGQNDEKWSILWFWDFWDLKCAF